MTRAVTLATTLALATLFPTGLHAGLGVSSLPEVTRDEFKASGNAAVAEYKARAGELFPGATQRPLAGWIYVAPVIYNMGFDEEERYWGSLQTTVDWVEWYLVDGLKKRGFLAAGHQERKAHYSHYEAWGDKPRVTIPLRDRAGKPMGPSVYASYKMKDVKPEHFAAINPASQGWDGAVFVKIHGAWNYAGHVRIGDQPVRVYDVTEWFEVTVCDHANRCSTQKVMPEKPPLSKRPTPSTKDQAEFDKWAMDVNAKTTADSAFVIIDALLRLSPAPPK